MKIFKIDSKGHFNVHRIIGFSTYEIIGFSIINPRVLKPGWKVEDAEDIENNGSIK